MPIKIPVPCTAILHPVRGPTQRGPTHSKVHTRPRSLLWKPRPVAPRPLNTGLGEVLLGEDGQRRPQTLYGILLFYCLLTKGTDLETAPPTHTFYTSGGVVSVPQLAFFSPLRTRLLLFSLAIVNPLPTSACTMVPPWPPLEWTAAPSALWTMTEQTADWAHCKLSHHHLCGLMWLT